MVTARKCCYKCLTEVDNSAKVCPRCGAGLGARMESGIAGKPGSPLLKILLIIVSLAIVGKLAVYSHSDNPETSSTSAVTGPDNVKDGAIQKIKEKGAGELSTVGVADLGYKDDTLCVYVDQRFNNLSTEQQKLLLALVAGEWGKAIGKTSTTVKILEYGTQKTLAELVV